MGLLRRATLILVSSVALFVAACGSDAGPWAERPGPKVLAFFPPIYSLADSIAGDDAQVLPLLTTKGPHDYEPRQSDARKLKGADLFLVNGLELDDEVTAKLASTSGNRSLRVVKLGDRVPAESLLEGGICRHDHGDGNTEHHHAKDPHVWLGIPETILMAEAIRDELIRLDPDHGSAYADRTTALTSRLRQLQSDGKKQLASKSEKARLLTHHDALRYFARSFGVEIVDSIELPGKEPSSKRLGELVEMCQKASVRLIAVEPQYPSHTGAQAVLRELRRKGVDAAFVELDPLETANANDLTRDFYERRMRQNLDNLTSALK